MIILHPAPSPCKLWADKYPCTHKYQAIVNVLLTSAVLVKTNKYMELGNLEKLMLIE